MTQSVLEQMGAQIDETAQRASRAATAVADALEEGGGAARRVTKQGSDAATALLNDTTRRVQKHPFETVAATFAAGIGTGALIGWMMRQKQRSNRAEGREYADMCEKVR